MHWPKVFGLASWKMRSGRRGHQNEVRHIQWSQRQQSLLLLELEVFCGGSYGVIRTTLEMRQISREGGGAVALLVTTKELSILAKWDRWGCIGQMAILVSWEIAKNSMYELVESLLDNLFFLRIVGLRHVCNKLEQ